MKNISRRPFNRVLRAAAKESVRSLGDPRLIAKLGKPVYQAKSFFRRSSGENSLSQMRRIAVIRLDGLGDTLMISPFLRELKRNAPLAEISLVVKPSVFPLVELCPYTSQIVTYDAFAPDKLGILRRHWRALSLSARYFWREDFDMVMVPRWEVYHDHEPFLAYFSGIRRRVGYSESVSLAKSQANTGTDFLLTQALHDSEIRHEVEYSLNTLRALGGTVRDDRLEIWLSARDEEVAEHFYRQHKISSENFVIAVCPGAAIDRRRWPIERFIEVSRWLYDTYSACILLVGGPQEKDLARRFERELQRPLINAQRAYLSIRETAAVLKRASLYFGNNTGPMHLAAASGVPAVEISCHPATASNSSENSPLRFKAWKVPGRVIQPHKPTPPCTDHCPSTVAHCIREVRIDEVKATLSEFIDTHVVAQHLNLSNETTSLRKFETKN